MSNQMPIDDYTFNIPQASFWTKSELEFPKLHKGIEIGTVVFYAMIPIAAVATILATGGFPHCMRAISQINIPVWKALLCFGPSSAFFGLMTVAVTRIVKKWIFSTNSFVKMSDDLFEDKKYLHWKKTDILLPLPDSYTIRQKVDGYSRGKTI